MRARRARHRPGHPLVLPHQVTDDPRFGNEALAVTPWSRIAEDVSTELELNGPRFLTGFGTNTRLGDRP